MGPLNSAPHIFLGYGRSALDDTIDQILARSAHRRHAQVAVTSFAQMVQIVELTDHVAVFPARVAARYGAKLEAYEGENQVFGREFEERVPRTGN